jgi:hypothetical protein
MPAPILYPPCAHEAVGFLELHDGAIKMFCGDCAYSIILHKRDEKTIRRLFTALETQTYA